jgi:SRSO17 transposase
MDANWKSDLERWLAPFLDALRHKTRARMCPASVAGLIGAGDRKSVQPMAARDGGVGYDQLHHFSAPAEPGTPRRLRRSCLPKPTG